MIKPLRPVLFDRIASDYATELSVRFFGPRALARATATLTRSLSRRYDDITEALGDVSGLEFAAMNDATGAATAKMINGHLTKLSNHNQRGFKEQWHTVFGMDPLVGDDGTLKALLGDTLSTSVNKIKGLNSAHYNELRNVLAIAYTKGLSTPEVSAEISRRFGISRNRARFIAVNEMGNLNAALTEHQQTTNGITHYVWRTSLDERVRPTHISKEGVTFAWNKPPEDTGHPGADYRCRCTAEPTFDDSLFEVIEPEVEPEPVSLGKATKDLRSELGLSQANVAEDLGKSRGWVSGVETGRNPLKDVDAATLRGYYKHKGASPEALDRVFGELEEIEYIPKIKPIIEPIKPQPFTVEVKPGVPDPNIPRGPNGQREILSSDAPEAILRGETFELKERSPGVYFADNDEVAAMVDARLEHFLKTTGLELDESQKLKWSGDRIFKTTLADKAEADLQYRKFLLKYAEDDKAALMLNGSDELVHALYEDGILTRRFIALADDDYLRLNETMRELRAVLSDENFTSPLTEASDIKDLVKIFNFKDKDLGEELLQNLLKPHRNGINLNDPYMVARLKDYDSEIANHTKLLGELTKELEDAGETTEMKIRKYLKDVSSRFSEDLDYNPLHGEFRPDPSWEFDPMAGKNIELDKYDLQSALLTSKDDPDLTGPIDIGRGSNTGVFVPHVTDDYTKAKSAVDEYLRGALRSKGNGKRKVLTIYTEDRAHYNSRLNIINEGTKLGAERKASVLVHEYGHFAEEINPVLGEGSRRYMLKLAIEQDRPMNLIFAGTSERGFLIDGFEDHYSGKVYAMRNNSLKSEDYDHGDLYATEVTSMAVQYLIDGQGGLSKLTKHGNRNLFNWLLSTVAGDFQ
jgi:SPP1 gp7 family putative phage head morphogenesis protein